MKFMDDSPNKDKLPLEVGVSTLINVFFRRSLTIFIAVIITVFFLAFLWLLSDYAKYMSAILLGISGIIALLFSISLIRRSATPFDRFLKRLFDILVSVLGIVSMLPILCLVAIGIKSDSKGPVFQLQPRLGKDGKMFNLIKFRTMVVSDAVSSDGLTSDRRITRVGRILRKTSLDEIPLLFNVLRGDMSLVGPPPLRPTEVEMYGEEAFRVFVKVRPGMTGLWQVSPENTYEKRVEYDMYYTCNWNMWMDIAILAKTVAVVSRGRAGY